jgi:segregation and condensation protein A
LDSEQPGYKVQLPFFEGPLDLLLSLVEESELDITEISLSQVTGQYREYLELLGKFDVEIESSYLVVFAQLLELKSRLLLPEPEPDDHHMFGFEVEPDEDDLVYRLKEYQRLKRAAGWLADREGQSLARYPHPSGLSEPETPLLHISLRSLHSAALRCLKPRKPFKESIDYKRIELSVPDRVEEIWTTLQEVQRSGGQRTSFSELLRREKKSKPLVVVTFLALLEMARRDRIELFQDGHVAEIQCRIKTPEQPPPPVRPPLSLN